MNMAKLNLSGQYLKSGPKILINDTSSLLIKERKKPDLIKTKNYLVFEINGKQSYCSSLYPTNNPSTFNLDYTGIKYSVTFKDDKVLIKERGVGQ